MGWSGQIQRQKDLLGLPQLPSKGCFESVGKLVFDICKLSEVTAMAMNE
jgi:hypothetical protein